MYIGVGSESVESGETTPVPVSGLGAVDRMVKTWSVLSGEGGVVTLHRVPVTCTCGAYATRTYCIARVMFVV